MSAEPSWERVENGVTTLEANWLFQLRRERYRSRTSGKEHDYFVMHLADAVNVIAVTPDHKLVFVRQFRAGSAEDSLEIPGGLLNEGEDPLVAGARELVEETGYSGDPPRLIGSVWSNPSLLTSRSITILVTNAVRTTDPHLDPSEELSVELVPESLLLDMIRKGEISHALVVTALLYWMAETSR